jgi:RimJ/RimL family protein N-acetyltransferase
MEIAFFTQRLNVTPILKVDSIDYDIVVSILTPKATAQLPDDWQIITSHQAAQKWLLQRLAEGPVYKISKKDSHSLIGFLFLYETNTNAGLELRLGYLLSEHFWGKGLASELIGGLITECKQQGVHYLIGGVTKDNIASAKVLTKNGFALVGNNSESGSETEFYEYRFL